MNDPTYWPLKWSSFLVRGGHYIYFIHYYFKLHPHAVVYIIYISLRDILVIYIYYIMRLCTQNFISSIRVGVRNLTKLHVRYLFPSWVYTYISIQTHIRNKTEKKNVQTALTEVSSWRRNITKFISINYVALARGTWTLYAQQCYTYSFRRSRLYNIYYVYIIYIHKRVCIAILFLFV